MRFKQWFSFVCEPVAGPILVSDFVLFLFFCSGLRAPYWNLECLPCRCVLSSDFLSFVNQWHHSIFHLLYCFGWDLQCFTHCRLEFRMPPCRCFLSKDVFCFETSGAVPILVNDTCFWICSGFLYSKRFLTRGLIGKDSNQELNLTKSGNCNFRIYRFLMDIPIRKRQPKTIHKMPLGSDQEILCFPPFSCIIFAIGDSSCFCNWLQTVLHGTSMIFHGDGNWWYLQGWTES